MNSVLRDVLDADARRGSIGGGKFYLRNLRHIQYSSSIVVRLYYRIINRFISIVYGLEISCEAKIGKGLYIGHPYCITINPKAIIGEKCNIHRGVLIGQENRGKREGAPHIGNCVWIGINSAIVGNITIGDDVLIAPNSFVNRDVPSHSIVFGNPCVIKQQENATLGYIE